MASWSPSQSDPLTVSYMCQFQLSSPMLPRDAPTPPCAATVCERVGNTLDSTAVLTPASESCSAARSPAPPAPTTTASNFLIATPTLSPQNLQGPSAAADEPEHGQGLEGQAQAGAFDVIHPDVAHAHPGVQQQADDEQKGGEAQPALAEQRLPGGVVMGVAAQQGDGHDDGVHRDDDGADALDQPAAQAVMGSDDDAVHHISTAATTVRMRLTANTVKLVARAAGRSMPFCRSRNR